MSNGTTPDTMDSKESQLVRIAIVGCGVIAPTQADALIALAPEGVKITACCDIDPEKAASFSKKYNVPAVEFGALLADTDIDAVAICTPSGLHSELASQSLLAGKHVVVEKPLDITLEACDKLIDAERRAGKVLACISQHRFDPASKFVRDAIERGELGDVILAEARVSWYRTQEYYDSGDWRGTWQLDGGGCLMNQGVHTVDLMLWLCGPAASVFAQCRTAAHERIEVEDVIVATVAFESGAIGSLMATTSAYPGFPVRLAIHGTSGSAIVEGDALQCYATVGQEMVEGAAPGSHAIRVAAGGTRSVGSSTPVPTDTATDSNDQAEISDLPGAPPRWGDSHRAQLAEFIRCCRTGERPSVGSREGRAAVELILAAYKSAKLGAPVLLGTGSK